MSLKDWYSIDNPLATKSSLEIYFEANFVNKNK